MIFTDPIADMLTRIRNANMVKHETVEIPASKIKQRLAEILLAEGFIKSFEVVENGKHSTIKIELKYVDNEKVITGLKRVSKPGLRIYRDRYSIPKVLGGLGIAIISTSHGVMTDSEARKKGIGGEVLCYVW